MTCRSPFIAALALACTLVGAAHAQRGTAAGDYPGKPIRLIVPVAYGGGTDIIARLIGQGLNDSWGQPVIVDNRPGGGGILGVGMVASSSADGHTLLVASNGHLSFLPALQSRLPYDPQKDLKPVSLIGKQPFVLAVHPSLPANSVKDLVALAKARPGAINYGSGGVGTVLHIAIELLQSLGGVSMLHVPYKGSGVAVTALIGNEIQVMVGGIATMLPHIAKGSIRALAVTGARRSELAPELPTIGETLPGYELDVWYGMVAPGGTPATIVTKLSSEVARVLKTRAISERFAAMRIEPLHNRPEQFAELIRDETAKWRKVVRSANIRVE